MARNTLTDHALLAGRRERIHLMDDDGHIFICDPPPGGKYVLTIPGKLTQEQIDRLKANWEEAMKNPKKQLIVLEEGMKLIWIPACPTWPDAEYCAA